MDDYYIMTFKAESSGRLFKSPSAGACTTLWRAHVIEASQLQTAQLINLTTQTFQ